jgi:hypothetical protein
MQHDDACGLARMRLQHAASNVRLRRAYEDVADDRAEDEVVEREDVRRPAVGTDD